MCHNNMYNVKIAVKHVYLCTCVHVCIKCIYKGTEKDTGEHPHLLAAIHVTCAERSGQGRYLNFIFNLCSIFGFGFIFLRGNKMQGQFTKHHTRITGAEVSSHAGRRGGVRSKQQTRNTFTTRPRRQDLENLRNTPTGRLTALTSISAPSTSPVTTITSQRYDAILTSGKSKQ